MLPSDKKEPLYQTIKRDIQRKIERGFWAIGDRVPPEEVLQAQYGVSRGTVRRALSDLEADGYISRISGRGTFVKRVTPKLQKPMGEIRSFAQQLARAGYEPVSEILTTERISVAAARGRVAEGFGLPDDAEIIHIQRLRAGRLRDDRIPFAIQSVYLRPDLCPDILERDLTRLFHLYESAYGRRIVTADEVVRVAAADDESAALLDIPPGAPVVIRDRISYDQYNTPFEVLHSVDRGDKFEYHYTILTDFTQTQPED